MQFYIGLADTTALDTTVFWSMVVTDLVRVTTLGFLKTVKAFPRRKVSKVSTVFDVLHNTMIAQAHEMAYC